jgi:NADPH:quinone reductase-like Zn-dependent oxidoreductase
MSDTHAALQATNFSIDALRLAERPRPLPRRGEVLVRLRAASLNHRDLSIMTENYLPNLRTPYVPASDSAGEVIMLGEGVTRWRVGDRVVPVYTQGWHDGAPTPEMRAQRTLGGPLEGTLQQHLVIPADDAVATPASLSDAEAATLPIAALTAWSTLVEGGVKPGATVLVQGTGGVALFALQFAKAAGAFVVATSSSDDKLQRARALGADAVVNYRSDAQWPQAVRTATDGRGADIIVETGGATLQQSLSAAAFGGFVGVVGFVAGYEAAFGVRQLLGPMLRVQGIAVGSRARFEAMNRAIEQHRIRPVIDSSFELADGAAAFWHMASGRHFGKIVITL